MLFLKYLDDLEQERAMEVELVGKPYEFIIDEAHPLSRRAEKNFRSIIGYKDLWTLEAALERSKVTFIDKNKKVA